MIADLWCDRESRKIPAKLAVYCWVSRSYRYRLSSNQHLHLQWRGLTPLEAFNAVSPDRGLTFANFKMGGLPSIPCSRPFIHTYPNAYFNNRIGGWISLTQLYLVRLWSRLPHRLKVFLPSSFNYIIFCAIHHMIHAILAEILAKIK